MRPRSYKEMKLFMELHPCERCGETDTSSLDRYSAGKGGDHIRTQVYHGACPGCGAARRFEFRVPVLWPKLPPHEYGGAEPSTILGPDVYLRQSDRNAAEVSASPASLTREEYYPARGALLRAISCMEEVGKFIPDGADQVPDEAFLSNDGVARKRAEPQRFTRAAIAEKIAELQALLELYQSLADEMARRKPAHPQPPPTRLTKETLHAHAAWLRRGRKGDGRLVLRDVEISATRLSNIKLSGAELIGCTLDRTDFGFSKLVGVRLQECSAVGAAFPHSELDEAVFERCTFARADLYLADLVDARITGGDWSGLLCDRGAWNRLKAKGVDFRDAFFGDCVLDGATFEDCDLRGADLSRVKASLKRLCSTYNARFIRCDLRGAKLDGRRLHGTKFIECKLHGVTGKPVIEGAYVIESPDFSATGDGSDVRGADAVFAMWGKPGA